MQNSLRDGIFNPHLATIKDSYIKYVTPDSRVAIQLAWQETNRKLYINFYWYFRSVEAVKAFEAHRPVQSPYQYIYFKNTKWSHYIPQETFCFYLGNCPLSKGRFYYSRSVEAHGMKINTPSLSVLLIFLNVPQLKEWQENLLHLLDPVITLLWLPFDLLYITKTLRVYQIT